MSAFRNELLSLLKRFGIEQKRSLSQVFLTDEHYLDAIISCAHIRPNEQVLEIGPGPGTLTRKLIAAGASVSAIEIDPRFVPLYETLPPFDLHLIDCRLFDYATFCNTHAPVKVVANIPYHLSQEIILSLGRLGEQLSSLFLLLDVHVAKRLLSPEKNSAFSTKAHYFFTCTRALKVPRGAFHPIPGVDSAVVHLTPRAPRFADHCAYFSFVDQIFQHKRKQIRIKDIALPDRAEDLSPLQIESLFESV